MGRAESAFIVACRDVLISGDYDLILKVHSKKSPQNGHNVRVACSSTTPWTTCCPHPATSATILGMFQNQPSLGMVFPPVVHIGFPTLGHSWFTNREAALAAGHRARDPHRLRPDDPGGPLRHDVLVPAADPRQARRATTSAYKDFAGEDEGWGDGMLGHVLERLYGYAVLDTGYTIRLVLNTDWAAINYAFLEYKLQRISSMLPAYTQEQVDWIEHIQIEDPPARAPEEGSPSTTSTPRSGPGPAPGLPGGPGATARGPRGIRGRRDGSGWR